MKHLDFTPNFEKFKTVFYRMVNDTPVATEGIVQPYQEAELPMHPSGLAAVPKIKVYVRPNDALDRNEHIIYENNRYVVQVPMNYSKHANVISYLASLIEENVGVP